MGTFSKLGSVRTAVTRSGCLLSPRAQGLVTARGPAQPAVPQWPWRGATTPPRGHGERGERRLLHVPPRSLRERRAPEHGRGVSETPGRPRATSRTSPPGRGSRLRVPGVTPHARRVPGTPESRLGRRAPVTARGGGIAHPAVRTLALVSVI